MKRRNHTLFLILLSFASGFAGGIASREVSTPALAQSHAEVVEAAEFRLISESGDTLGTFKATPESGSIVLFNRAGQVVWVAPQPALQPLAH